jgi:hypothetical protein
MASGEKMLRPTPYFIQLVSDVTAQIAADQPFRKRCCLSHEEPVIRFKAPAKRHMRESAIGRNDLQTSDPLDAGGVVESHPESDARAAVVTRYGKAAKPHGLHQLEVVFAHCPERIGGMVKAAIRF